jgi:hypothetical protein
MYSVLLGQFSYGSMHHFIPRWRPCDASPIAVRGFPAFFLSIVSRRHSVGLSETPRYKQSHFFQQISSCLCQSLRFIAILLFSVLPVFPVWANNEIATNNTFEALLSLPQTQPEEGNWKHVAPEGFDSEDEAELIRWLIRWLNRHMWLRSC